jgi:hypothetical protein
MTAKEKAQELFNKFADIEHLGVYGEYDGTWEWSSSLWRQQAKECALIAINEILYIRNGLYFNEGSIAHQWWLDVKHEIENL